jgi:hypothetical protein
MSQEAGNTLMRVFRAEGIRTEREKTSACGRILFSKTTAGDVCGGLFLAWLPEARDEAAHQRRVLA